MKYNNQVKEFIAKNVKGKSSKELAEMVNERFGEDLFTESKMKSFKNNHKLKSGTLGGIKKGSPSAEYPKEIGEYIRNNHKGVGHQDMADRLNSIFGKSYTAAQIKSYYANHKINSGLNGHYHKGHEPFNKGRKGCFAPGCEKGWFKRGHTPKNHKPIGSERIDVKDGYTLIKTAEPNTWDLKHRVIWEAANGPLPEGQLLTFLDGDRTNITLENLAVISMAESLTMTRKGLRNEFPELTKTGILVAKVHVAKNKAKKRRVSHEQKNKSIS